MLFRSRTYNCRLARHLTSTCLTRACRSAGHRQNGVTWIGPENRRNMVLVELRRRDGGDDFACCLRNDCVHPSCCARTGVDTCEGGLLIRNHICRGTQGHGQSSREYDWLGEHLGGLSVDCWVLRSVKCRAKLFCCVDCCWSRKMLVKEECQSRKSGVEDGDALESMQNVVDADESK